MIAALEFMLLIGSVVNIMVNPHPIIRFISTLTVVVSTFAITFALGNAI